MSKVILDASAVLALLNQEPGYEKVESHLDNAVISSVNLAEVFTILLDIGVPKEEIASLVTEIVKEIIPFDTEQALVSASLRKATKNLGLSLGDRACLALAKILNLPVLTADRAWSKINVPIKIISIR